MREVGFQLEYEQKGEVIVLPTYGYQCTQCKHEFSVFQSMKDDPVTAGPSCPGSVKRLLYPVGIVFKGSGWYINDSRKPDTSESATPAVSGSKDGEAKSGDSSTEAKTDTKSDAKSDTNTDTKKDSSTATAAKS